MGEFSRAIHAFGANGLTPDDFTYPSWDAAFAAIANLAVERRLVVVLDEFPYLVEADPELPTLLQREWDLRLQHTQVFLVLSGSIQSVIQQQVLAPTAPLYRRHTWPFELKPLTLADLPAFFPRYTAEQLVETYAVLRGNRWLGGDTGWDVHYALFAREFGQVRESAGKEPGFYFFQPEDVLQIG